MSNDERAPNTIRVIDVVKSFDGGIVRALDGASMEVRQGEFVAVTGPSGCGKSTLLHLIAALDSPTSGSIIVNGRDLNSSGNLDRYRRNEIGLVFQLHHLLPHLTALQNVEIAMFSNGKRHREQRARAMELLAAVGLSTKERTVPPKLSGGERQRLAIARALANNPPILLADEPTGSLDTAAVENLLALLQRIRQDQGLTLLLVTHDAHAAEAANRIVHMRDGKIVDQPADVTRSRVDA
jgi:putative ABC transport system ATP-binding protein